MAANPPLVVLDDDPTGAQSQAGVPVALEWKPELLARVAAEAPPAVHLLTNTRALFAAEAEALTRQAASAAAAAFPRSPVFLRGDSTLRAHLLPEYRGLRDALYPGRDPVLMLVPALPAAGRVTQDGVHYLERDGVRLRLEATEYARDPDFAYTSSRLLDWADERSNGFFPAAAGSELRLRELRENGRHAVRDALVALDAASTPAVLAVDAVDVFDLEVAAEGLRLALAMGVEVIVRSAPAFVGVFSGAAADGFLEPPASPGPVLVLCGSHVPTSTRQLGRLLDRHPESFVWVRPERLAGERSGEEVSGAVTAARERLGDGGLAVVATAREVYENGDRLASGAAIASGLAAILAGTRERSGLVISKGGITSAVNVREGLASGLAEVQGPLRDGISLWSVDTPERAALPFVVFPGNVGGEDELADLVDSVGVAA